MKDNIRTNDDGTFSIMDSNGNVICTTNHNPYKDESYFLYDDKETHYCSFCRKDTDHTAETCPTHLDDDYESGFQVSRRKVTKASAARKARSAGLAHR